jgi:uncharacterized cupredoxin-like copper-binding protein
VGLHARPDRRDFEIRYQHNSDFHQPAEVLRVTSSRRQFIVSVSAAVPLVILGRSANASTLVQVSLWDNGPSSQEVLETAKPMGLAMPEADMSMATMHISAEPAKIPPGEVTFMAKNDSAEFVHEMVIARVRDPSQPLAYIDEDMEVDEDGAGFRGKVSELGPGQTAGITLVVKTGTYMIYCNIAGHYAMGMWTLVTVAA